MSMMLLHRAWLTTTRALPPLASRHHLAPCHQQQHHHKPLLPLPNRVTVAKPRFLFTPPGQLQSHRHQNLSEYFQNIEPTLYSPEVNHQRPSNLRFVPYENIFAYQLIKREIANGDTDLKSQCDHCQDLSALKELIVSGKLYDNKHNWNEQMSRIVKRLTSVSHDEAIELLKHFVKFVPVFTEEADWGRVFLSSNFTKIWNTLDDATVRLVKSETWQDNLNKLFQIADLWFELGLNKQIDFVESLVERIAKCKTLEWDKETLLHVMFYLNLERSMDSRENSVIDKTEHYLTTHEDLNLDELAIIGMGFFKTQTKMPYNLLMSYLKHCQRELSCDHCEVRGTISVASILKVIRFSLNTYNFDARLIRNELRVIVEGFYRHQINLLDSNICLTHLLGLLNSSFLFQKRIYRMVFDRLIENPSAFRIKDIDKILFCFSNLQFRCWKAKLNKLEQYLERCEESQIYPYHVYNIVLFLLSLDYYPYRLIRMCRQPDFLAKSLETTKMPLDASLLNIETILRLELPTQSFLTEDQITNCLVELSHTFGNVLSNSKRYRFIRVFQDTLQAHCGQRFRLMHLLPYSAYPVLVILTDRLVDKLALHRRQIPTEVKNSFTRCDQFNVNQLKANYFKDCIAINLLMNKDFTWEGNTRGAACLNRRLLERLGFHVVEFSQRALMGDLVLPVTIDKDSNYAQPSLIPIIQQEIHNTRPDI